MYQTDDMENGITIKDCFKNLAELAWETRAIDSSLADKFFDILVECLGVDFRLTFEVDRDRELVPNGNVASLISNNFRTMSACISNIDLLFRNFPYMVKEGSFSPEYVLFLQQRRNVLLELIAFQNSVVSKNNSTDEMNKIVILNNDITLIDARIALANENLDTRGR